MKKQDVDEGTRKKMLSLFILFFPSLIIAVVPNEIDNGVIIPLVLKGLILFLQFVIIKNFVDTHYGEWLS